MSSTTGDLRSTLLLAIQQVRGGQISPDKAKAIAMLAGQVTASIAVELRARELLQLKTPAIGSLAIGEAPIEGKTRVVKMEEDPE